MNNEQLNAERMFFFRALNYLARRRKENRITKEWAKSNNDFLDLNRKKLLLLKDKHKNEPCFVIGNGPSINKMDLNHLKDKVTIACNSFYLKYGEIEFTPTYYTVEDPLPAIDNQVEINNLNGSIKVIPYDLKEIITPKQDVIYLNFLRSYLRPSNKNFPRFSFDVDNVVYWGGTVIYMNIQLARYLGCNPIYLIGIDLDYKIPKNVKKRGHVLTSTDDDPNHFHPGYFGRGKKWHLPEVERMQKSFTHAYEVLREDNTQLINGTAGGNLKNIPRVDFAEIFQKF